MMLDSFAHNNLLHQAYTESTSDLDVNATSGKAVAFIALGCDLAKEELYRYIISITQIKAIVIESEGNELVSRLSDSCKNVIPISLSLESRPTLVQEVVDAINTALIANGIDTLDAIHTYWDDAVALAARVATHYQLPTNPIRSIDIAHDKSASREFLRDLGYASPSSRVIKSIKEIDDDFLASTAFPVILKPCYGAASIGVMRVDRSEELIEKYLKVIDILTLCYQENDLMGLLFDQQSNETNSPLYHVVVEQFLKGREYDCDIILRDGEVIWSELCDDWEFEPPHFIELGSNVPTTTSPDREAIVKEYGAQVVDALGLTMGVHHVEIIDDETLGPVLVECNPRMGGGPVRMNHLLVHRVDIAIEALYSSLNIYRPMNTGSPNRRKLSNATACLYATGSGILLRSGQSILEEVIRDYKHNVIVATCGAREGAELRGWHNVGSHPSGLGLLSISIEGSVEDAKALVNKLREEFLELVLRNLKQE